MPVDPQMLQYFQGEWNAGRLTSPQNAILNLIQDPRNFLRKHPIQNNFDCNAHGVTQAYFRNQGADAKRPGKMLGTKRYHTTESFNLENVNGQNAYGSSFPVHGVCMGQSHLGPNWYRLDHTGPAVMLTAKLTGCTFVARAAPGGAIEVTHMQPSQETGLALNQRMQGGGRMAYGRLRYAYDTRSINIIGVRSGGRWRIWAQKLNKNATPLRIVSLNRIWPT